MVQILGSYLEWVMSYRADNLGAGQTNGLKAGQLDAGNNNTRRPILASSNKIIYATNNPVNMGLAEYEVGIHVMIYNGKALS